MKRSTNTFNQRIFKKKLKSFMINGDEDGMSNTWLKIGKSEIYVRRWDASVPGEYDTRKVFLDFARRPHINVLDIASLRIHKTARRQGHFKKLLKTSEKLAKKLGCDVIHVECVHNETLHPYLRGVGYDRLPKLNECYAKNISIGSIAA